MLSHHSTMKKQRIRCRVLHGARVIEQTIREKLPEGFQTSEYLMEHGMVDMVVKRHDIPDTLARTLKILMKKPVDAAKLNGAAPAALPIAASA